MSENTRIDSHENEPPDSTSLGKRRRPLVPALAAAVGLALGVGSGIALGKATNDPADPYPRFNCVLNADPIVLGLNDDNAPDLYVDEKLILRTDSRLYLINLGKDAAGNTVALPDKLGMATQEVYTYRGPGAQAISRRQDFEQVGLLLSVPQAGPASYALYSAPEKGQGGSDLCVAFHLDASGKVDVVSADGHLPDVEVPQSQLALYTSFGRS